ncbi:MAG: four helix bundle protein [Bacteroidales bacterium]|nr:four helix bundle protein [Bacteroidales bacterium]
MKKDNVIKEKSYKFAVRIVRLSQMLCSGRSEYVLSKQVLRSGTAIGELVRESEHAQSKADFIHKMSIALKEANESDYWLMLLKDTGYIDIPSYTSIQNDVDELISILVRIIKTAKKN